MQEEQVWLFGPPLGPGTAHAKSPLRPGSIGMSRLGDSVRPGRCRHVRRSSQRLAMQERRQSTTTNQFTRRYWPRASRKPINWRRIYQTWLMRAWLPGSSQARMDRETNQTLSFLEHFSPCSPNSPPCYRIPPPPPTHQLPSPTQVPSGYID
jgi:hypothetical protein